MQHDASTTRLTPVNQGTPAAANPVLISLLGACLALGSVAVPADDAETPRPRIEQDDATGAPAGHAPGRWIISPPLEPIAPDADTEVVESATGIVDDTEAEPATADAEAESPEPAATAPDPEMTSASGTDAPAVPNTGTADTLAAAEQALDAGEYERALQLLHLAAAQDDPEAQTRLGDVYMQGLGVAQSHDRAMLWYRRAARQEHARAQFNLGNMYLLGEGVLQDDETAREWYALAAEQGHSDARSNLENLERLMKTRVSPLDTRPPAPVMEIQEEVLTAMQTESEAALQGTGPGTGEAAALPDRSLAPGRVVTPPVDSPEPIRSIAEAPTEADPPSAEPAAGVDSDPPEAAPGVEPGQAAAAATDAKALFEQGQELALGDGLNRDAVVAVDYYRRAAELGYAPAQYRLGAAYHYGDGVTRDPARAAEWYRRAAEQGFTMAQRNLGNLYLRGEGVARDKIQAMAWLSLVAARGSDIDRRQQAQLAESLSEAELEQARQLAAEFGASGN